MGRVKAHVDVPGRAFEAEQLWYDTTRWPAFVSGLHNVSRLDAGWPQEPGARVVWDTTPEGRGRVIEIVQEFEARSHQTVLVEDSEIRGTQTVRFLPRDDGVRVQLEIEYRIKREKGWVPLVDLVFVRRPMRDQLQRTLNQFARELRSDRELLT